MCLEIKEDFAISIQIYSLRFSIYKKMIQTSEVLNFYFSIWMIFAKITFPKKMLII